MNKYDKVREEAALGELSRRDVLTTGTAALAGVAAGSLVGAAGAQAAPEVGLDASLLRGQVALVTGGARGIGRAIAVALARAGADVAVLDIAQDIQGHPVPMATQNDLAETVRLVGATGRRALSLQADIRSLSQVQAAADRVVRDLGRIDILVANAGINTNTSLVTPAGEAGDRAWRNVIDVNVIGTANTLRAALPHMTGRGSGRVIVTTSTFGRQGNAANPNYVASKWALVGLIKAAAIEAGPRGVAVNGIAPTAVETGLGGPQTPEQRAQANEFLRENYHFLPVGLLQPQDVAGAAVFLASPAAQYVSGVVIDVAAAANARYTA